MEDKETLEKLDSICNATIMHLFSLSQSKFNAKCLKLRGYNDSLMSHRTVLQLAHSLESITKIPVYVHGCGIKAIHAIRRKKLKWLWLGRNGVEIELIVHAIEKAFDEPCILAQIYETYYK